MLNVQYQHALLLSVRLAPQVLSHPSAQQLVLENKSSGNLSPQVTPFSPEDREDWEAEASGSRRRCSWAQGATKAWEQRIWGSGAGGTGRKVFGVNPLLIIHTSTALLNLSDVFINVVIIFKMARRLQVFTGNICGKVRHRQRNFSVSLFFLIETLNCGSRITFALLEQ